MHPLALVEGLTENATLVAPSPAEADVHVAAEPVTLVRRQAAV